MRPLPYTSYIPVMVKNLGKRKEKQEIKITTAKVSKSPSVLGEATS